MTQDVELEKLTADEQRRSHLDRDGVQELAGVSNSRISGTSVAGGVTLVVRASPIAWQPA